MCKSNSKYAYVPKTVTGLAAVVDIHKEHKEELHLPELNNISEVILWQLVYPTLHPKAISYCLKIFDRGLLNAN